jgi:hypothetical protein
MPGIVFVGGVRNAASAAAVSLVYNAPRASSTQPTRNAVSNEKLIMVEQ